MAQISNPTFSTNNPIASMGLTNLPQFHNALRNYIAATEKELSVVLNTKLFYIARAACQDTPRANRPKYERELGVESLRVLTYKRTGAVKLDKKGRVRTSRVMRKGAALVYKIINARRGRAGKKGLHGADMRRAVGSLFSKRARSVGTLRAGWLGAIRTLARSIGQGREFIDGASGRVEGRSRAVIAKPGINPQASLTYTTNSFDQGHQPYIDQRVTEALNRAFAAETRSIDEYLANKLSQRALQAYRESMANLPKAA